MESANKWSLSQGLDMEIVHHAPKMRSVVNLVIAMERLKAGVMELHDGELLSLILENTVDGELPSSKASDQSGDTHVTNRLKWD